jgi:TctA family transporter
MQHKYKHAAVVHLLPGIDPPATMEVLMESVFSTDPPRGFITGLIYLGSEY